jgi:Arc-like DNA binding domain
MAHKPKAMVKLNLRLDAPLHERLSKAAEKNHRSLQTEIVARLEQTFRNEVPEIFMTAIKNAVETTIAEMEAQHKLREGLVRIEEKLWRMMTPEQRQQAQAGPPEGEEVKMERLKRAVGK